MSGTRKARRRNRTVAEPSFRYNAKLAQGIEEKWQKILGLRKQIFRPPTSTAT